MKKKIWIPIIIVVLLLVLFLPIPSGAYKDGGSRSYTALTYKIVDWNRSVSEPIVYDDTKIYFFPNNFKSIDELWEIEKESVNYPTIKVKVLEIYETSVLVEAIDNKEGQPGGQITFGTNVLEEMGNLAVGDIVEVTYTGVVMETYPAQITALSWKYSDDIRDMEYTGEWIDKTTAEKYNNNIFDHIRITKIYSNCFFARTVAPMPYEIKLNGKLGDNWCIGDQISCTYENTYYDAENQRVEVDMLTVEASDWEPDPNVALKPVIYLYPEEETEVKVDLDYSGELTCTYPAYNKGWTVTASPDGTLTDKNGQTYNYLYWEGETYTQYDLSKGFCVKGEDTAEFLEKALSDFGLTRREANEFIVYWLPLMEQNPYNIISFQTDAYTDSAKLNVNPAPDTLIRVFMAWQASDNFVDLPEQDLSAPERKGFTVVEWGGAEITE